MLSLGLFLDFASGRVTRVKLGQSTTIAKATATALVRCAEEVVIGTRLDDVTHEHTSYWMYHLVRFLPPGQLRRPGLGGCCRTRGERTAVRRRSVMPPASCATNPRAEPVSPLGSRTAHA